jgi:hypothetical protein
VALRPQRFFLQHELQLSQQAGSQQAAAAPQAGSQQSAAAPQAGSQPEPQQLLPQRSNNPRRRPNSLQRRQQLLQLLHESQQVDAWPQAGSQAFSQQVGSQQAD